MGRCYTGEAMSLLSPEDLAACEAVTASSSLIANRIIDAVAQHAGISRAQIIGPDRSERIARARQITMLVCYNNGLSSVEIGRALGRDQTTVVHGVKREKARRKAENAQ